jgi:WD40 repeat protein
VVTWDWSEGDIVRIIDTPAREALSSPTGELVATTTQLPTPTGMGGPVDVWDPTTGRHVATLAGSSTGVVLDLAFDADGSRLAASGQDGTVRIWDPSSGEQVLALPGHYPAFSVAFSPDGSRLASVGSDGVVRVWALELDELVNIAEDEVTRDLTDDECRQYLHEPDCG